MAEPTSRVLVAVEPVVLEGAFAAILEAIGLDEVVQFHIATAADRGARYDAAITSEGLARSVCADVVITLPRIEGSGGPPGPAHGHVTKGKVSEAVDIRGEREVIGLLDEHVPRAAARSDNLSRLPPS